jgi:hypothetical protein
MTILKDVELYFTKLVADKPVVINEDSDKPASEAKVEGMRKAGASAKDIENAESGKITGWELEGRTTNKKQSQAWKKTLGSKLVKAIREDKEDEESPIKYWRIKLKRKQFKASGEFSDAPDVVRGDTLEDLDPKLIGNGSIGDVRIYQYDYSFRQGGGTVEGTASVLMGVKLKKLVKYEPKDREDFEKGGFVVVDSDGEPTQKESDGSYVGDDEEDDGKKSKGKAKGKANRDLEDEIPF